MCYARKPEALLTVVLLLPWAAVLGQPTRSPGLAQRNQDRKAERPAAPARAFVVDRGGRLSTEAVLGRPGVAGLRANFGYSDTVIYQRLIFPEGLPPGRILEVSYPQLDLVGVFIPDGERLRVERAGDIYPFSFRALPHRTFLFELPELARGHAILLRFESTGSLDLSTRVLRRDELYETFSRELLVFGCYAGIAGVMAALYLFVFFTVRERSSLDYALHVVGQAGFELCVSALAFQHLWPQSPHWANISSPLFGAGSLYFALRFTRAFLDLELRLPVLNAALRFLGFVPIGIAFLLAFGFFSLGSRAVSALAVLFAPLVLIVAAVLWSRGYRPARLFLAGWSFFLLGILGYVLFLNGLTPAGFWFEHSMRLGSGLQMLILAFAITARIGTLRREKEDAQAHALVAERRRRRLQEKMAHRLKRLVERRTAELSAANSGLLARDREVRRELELAARIQRGLLPPENLELPGLRVATYCHYVTGVGGDYIDIFRFRRRALALGGAGRVGILSADVSGHGIPAALVTSMAKICFQDAARNHASPRRVVLEVNRSLLERVAAGSYLTAFYLTIDDRYRVRFSGGGHPDALVWRRALNSIETWGAPGFLIGALPGMEDLFAEGEGRLSAGDRIVLYTDGFVESADRSGRPFGVERLKALVGEVGGVPLPLALQQLVATFDAETDANARADDCSIVLVEADPGCRGDGGSVPDSVPHRRSGEQAAGAKGDA